MSDPSNPKLDEMLSWIEGSLDFDSASARVVELETLARAGELDRFQQSELHLVACWLVDHARQQNTYLRDTAGGFYTLAALVQRYRQLQDEQAHPDRWPALREHEETLESEIDVVLDALGYRVDPTKEYTS